MKLSKNTIAVLSNFASINLSIMFRKGNVLRTISPQKNIFGRAEIDEVFDREFAIYDLNKFIGVLSLYEDPELELGDSHIKIRENGNTTVYYYADPKIIVAAPDKELELPSVDASVQVSSEQLSSIIKAASVIGVKDITLKGDGKKVILMTHDIKNPTSNSFDITLGKTDQTFNVDFKIEHLKVVSDTYTIDVSEKLISHWKGKSSGMEYWVACQGTSSFNK